MRLFVSRGTIVVERCFTPGLNTFVAAQMDSDPPSDPESDVVVQPPPPPPVPIAFTSKMVFGWMDQHDGCELTSKQPSRITGCSFQHVQIETEKLNAAGFHVHVFPLNISKFKCNAENVKIEAVHENKQNAIGANFDVQETKFKDEPSWEPGHAEITALAINAFEIADMVTRSPKRAVVVCSKNGGDAMKTLVCCVALAVKAIDRKNAKFVLRGRLPQPKDSRLKKFVDAFSKFTRQDAVSKSEGFYFSEF